MSESSENLQSLFARLGIKSEDPIFEDEIPESRSRYSSSDNGRASSPHDGEWCDSLPLEDDYIGATYGTTPPRTERMRKQKERNAYCSQAVEAARAVSTRARHKSASRCFSLPAAGHLDNILGSSGSHNFYKNRKRSQDIQRSHDRQYKSKADEIVENPCTPEDSDQETDRSETRTESLPPVYSTAHKVFQIARYMSVSSKLIGGKWPNSRKISSTEYPSDRVAFHDLMAGLLKPVGQEQFGTKIKSEEEALYQQELSEMIWLELRAWHSEEDAHICDNILLDKRKKVQEVYDEIMNFSFSQLIQTLGRPGDVNRKHSPTPASCFNDDPFLFCSDHSIKDMSSCLSVWCENCRESQSLALYHVRILLEKEEEVSALFPSSAMLAVYLPKWKGAAFVSRYKALCLWYNTTSQLRLVTELLGRRLGGDGYTDSIPWPSFPEVKVKSADLSIGSRDSGNHSTEEVPPEVASIRLPVAPCVKFQFEQSPDTSVDPSHSNESNVTSASGSSFGGVKVTDHLVDSAIKMADNLVDSGNDFQLVDHLSPPPHPGELRRSSSDVFMEANPFKTYVENLLRHKGMKKTIDKVAEVIKEVMTRTYCVLDQTHKCPWRPSKQDEADSQLIIHPLTALQEELKLADSWTDLFNSMGLPHFYALFLFLSSVPLHMMRECLKLRLEHIPNKPSKLSIKQLMREYKEGVKLAVSVRQKYSKCCRIILPGLPICLAYNLETRKSHSIEELDTNVKKMVEVYLEWLDQFILMLHKEPHVSGLQRTFLQDEWRFVLANCPYVTDGESLAATRFCNIACHMLCSVRDFLDTGLDEMISVMEESAFEDESSSSDDDQVKVYTEEEDEQDVERRKLVHRCRALQDLIGEGRERALRAIALAKMLRKDLEVAVEGTIISNFQIFLNGLLSMKHVLITGHNIDRLMIFVPGVFENSSEDILCLLQMQIRESDCYQRCDKYFILVTYPEEDFAWKGTTLNLALTADCTILLSRVQVSSLMLVTKSVCQLHPIKGKVASSLANLVSFSSEQIAPHEAVTYSLIDMKNEAVELCKNLEKSITEVQKLVSIEHIWHNEEEKRQLTHLIRDSVHQGFLFGFEYHKEVMRILSGVQKKELVPLLVNFACKWIRFVKVHYSVGRGCRPRWALPGLDFLLFVCDPHNTCHISDAEFKTLRLEIEDAREHIVGSANSNSSTPSTPVLCHKGFRSQASFHSTNSEASPCSEPRIRLHTSSRPVSQSFSIDEFDSCKENRTERVQRKVAELDRRREEGRFNEKIIGKVSQHQRDQIEIKAHSVSFSWQRGFKIGAGHFAKVYSVVNNNTGELLAMKVLPLQPNDHRSIKKVARELHTFERISHPHLVKYYGVEIHNDEMRIFMEYCPEGTLEDMAASTEGFPEEIIRKYTRQLLLGLHQLHENGIAHRDIKGANIFLAKEGNTLKLGDFGCAVRIRGGHTEAGELKGIVGTHAFMAPEIICSNEGHGRAADIWSVGCVVIEMATGQRPWPEYESSVQIMFQVGQGKSPAAPDNLSEEGHDFLDMCFHYDPKLRANTAKLLDHTFVKVEDEDLLSLPIPIVSTL